MGVIKKLANLKYESGANYELGRSMSSSAVSNIFGQGGASINVLEEYNGFAWKAINIRAELLADQNVFIERKVGDKWQEDLGHEFNDVLEGGDGSIDLSELLEAHEKSMCLYGESFWYYSKIAGRNKPYAIYLLDPSAMTVMVSGQRVTGYVYQKDTERLTLEIDEVDHYKVYDPRHPFRGTGPMQMAGWFVRSARYVNTYVNNFLENNAIPAGVVVAKGQVNDDDWKLFKEQWMAKHSGINNAGKTGFVRSTDLDFIKTGLSLGEVDFEKMKNTSRDDVMVMFGISKPMMAIFDDINRASAVTARQLAAVTLTSPSLKRITRKTTKKVAKWYGPNFRVGSTNPIPEDAETKLQEYDKGVGRWFTVNEARAAYGKEPIKGGDELDVNKAPKQTDEKSKAVGYIRVKNKKAEFSYEMKESYRSQVEELQVEYEQKVLEASRPVLIAQKEMVLDQISPKKVVDAHFNPINEAGTLSAATLPVYVELAQKQGDISAVFAGNPDSKFELTAVMKRYIEDSIGKAALSFTEETQEKIAGAIKEGLEASESIAAIAKRINAIYDEIIPPKSSRTENEAWRSERLARTEVIKTSNEIAEASYRQSGVVSKKEWFTNPGACEFCKTLNGSVMPLGGTFIPKDSTIEGADGGTRANSYEDVKHPPQHPACRCTLIPVIDEV